MHPPSKSPVRIFLLEVINYVLWHVASIAGLSAILFVMLWINLPGPESAWSFWLDGMRVALKQPGFYLLTLAPYLLFLLTRSLIKNYQQSNWPGVVKGMLFKIVLPALIVWGCLGIIDAYRMSERFSYRWDHSVANMSPTIRNLYGIDGKQRGIHVFDLESDSTDLAILKTQNIEWVTIVPYISQEVYDRPPARIVSDSLALVRRAERLRTYTRLADRHGFHLALKPHIWLTTTPENTWRSDIAMRSEADWDAWFTFYTTTILSYATLAEELGIELLCVGTELQNTIATHPERWIGLIEQVREVYSGAITYAANWSDPLEEIPFWELLDYVGIQAYFPVAMQPSPGLDELRAGWQPHVERLDALSQQTGKPILFTELGYKSTTDAGVTPWEWVSPLDRFYRPISHRTQALCYQAFFDEVWPRPWLAGAHLWEWQTRGISDGRNNSFGLEGKPVLNVVARGFAAPMSPGVAE